ncbi:hypothetical protein J3R80_13615 [Aliiroseovarius sp. Z3]|uniref:hypothetical protein n=1 Tax=Aliiroseovarius sp. Z3 TaxID=2811402 RepID=UPI0023B24799|nr:hypothetical protein [Aliiroseovarius sp. Z3]MDE9451506.1 hypothetical protein [Aliiroseovarius sp. Z3]
MAAWSSQIVACERSEDVIDSLQVGGVVSSPITFVDEATAFPEVIFIDATGRANVEPPFVSVDVELTDQSNDSRIRLGNFAILPGQQGELSFAFELPGDDQSRQNILERIRTGEFSVRLEAHAGDNTTASQEILTINRVTLGRAEP